MSVLPGLDPAGTGRGPAKRQLNRKSLPTPALPDAIFDFLVA
jgi:hypothetical protein